MKFSSKRIFVAWLLVPALFSCASYRSSVSSYYKELNAGNYAKAERSLQHNRLLQKNRNALLYNLEMGRLLQLQNKYAESNNYFNRADALIENNRKNLSDVVLGNLLNPMHESYRGEDFEQFMMHFYKAVNYAALGQSDEAVVEARRITMSNNSQADKFKNAANRYSKDAFGMNLQGMIYEAAGDMNNAFIAYRNATELYMNSGKNYYGVSMPYQLQSDLLRSAKAMGFSDEHDRYMQAFNVSNVAHADTSGELILFIEEGVAPVKEESNFFITTSDRGIGSFNYADGNGNSSNFEFDYNSYGIGSERLSDIRTLRIAMPVYRVQYPRAHAVAVTNNGSTFTAEPAEDLNNVAVNVLKERFVNELAKALARQLTKKVVEKGTQAAAESVAKSDDNVDKDASEEEKEKQKKKNKEKAEHAGEVAGLLVNIAGTLSEKADTRNWQSLPAFVHYVRIPLHAGENTIRVSSNGKLKELIVSGTRGLQMRSVTI